MNLDELLAIVIIIFLIAAFVVFAGSLLSSEFDFYTCLLNFC